MAPHFETKKPQLNQRPSSLPVAPATPRYFCKVRRLASRKSDSKSAAYENRTKSAQSGGLETNGPRERISGPDGLNAVRRFCAKPVVIGDFSAANLGGESWSQKDWRSERNCQLTLSTLWKTHAASFFGARPASRRSMVMIITTSGPS